MTQPPMPPQDSLSYASTPQGIREIAQRQRAIMLCILGAMVLYAALIVGKSALPPIVVGLLALAYLGVAVTATVFVFLLATKVYGTGVGILLGILTLIPCIGLIVLLIVNGKATAILKQRGIPVGLLGADMSKL